MKQFLLILALISYTLITSATTTKPLPHFTSVKEFGPITNLQVFVNETSFRRFLTVKVWREFAFNFCETTTIQVKLWKRYQVFRPGFPPTYVWGWIYQSFQLTIPAYEDNVYVHYELENGEDADENDYISPGYFTPCL
jgi:hypothetical protein